MKRIISIFLLVSLALSLFAFSASAIEVIEELEIKFRETPKNGGCINDANPYVPDAWGCSPIGINLYAHQTDGTWKIVNNWEEKYFQSGTEYRYEMWLHVEEHYEFNTVHQPKVYLPTGMTSEILTIGKEELKLYLTFTPIDTIAEVEIKMTSTPVVGGIFRDSTPVVSADCGYWIGGMNLYSHETDGTWKLVGDWDENSYQLETEYRFEIWVYPNNGYAFEDDRYPDIYFPKGMKLDNLGFAPTADNSLKLHLTFTPKVVPPSMFFNDVKVNDWFYSDVEYVYYSRMMNGVGNGNFDPYGTCTRAMVVTVLYRLQEEPDVSSLSCPFKDVPANEWYFNAVKWAADCGVVDGTSPTTFEPDAPITREQFATILYRFAGEVLGQDVSDGVMLAGFTDANEISPWATNAISWAFGKDIIHGEDTDSGKFLNPGDSAERCQIAAMLHRFCEKCVVE